MKMPRNTYILLLFILSFLFTGCIHEHPFGQEKPGWSFPDNDPGNNGGNSQGEAGNIKARIEVNFNLDWSRVSHKIDFKTKALRDTAHRFIIEVKESGYTVCSDIIYLSDEEYEHGTLTHTLTQNLSNKKYQIAAWYDLRDEESKGFFETESLSDVNMVKLSTSGEEKRGCAYSVEELDLSDLKNEDVSVTKLLEMRHPVGAFEIVSTDIQEFITQQKPALEQGDKYSVKLTITQGAHHHFDLFNNKIWSNSDQMEMTGPMRLPFAEYDELKIAQGFFFCKEEDEVSAKLSVYNSSLFLVSETDYFTFPVKRGQVTVIEGDFLTHPVEGIFTIDNIWEGEIEYEI